MFKKSNVFVLVSLTFAGLSTLAGCMPEKSNLLTRLPEDQIWKSQTPSPIAIKNQKHKIYREGNKAREQYLASFPKEIQQAFMEYQKTGIAPVIQNNNFIWFPYSESVQQTLTCEPLHTCDITLEKGETIFPIRGGDTQRWIYDRVYSGYGENREPHALIKPKYTDINTDVVITTDRRTYHIALTSKPDNYVKQAKFYYPDDMKNHLEELKNITLSQIEKAQTIVPSVPALDPALRDCHYSIREACCVLNPAWKPLHAFNDGTHVFIEMPAQLRVTDAPVLFIQGKDGSEELVNYRVKKNYYIVDQLFKQAVMVSGVGDAQEKIVITYTG